MSGTYLLDTHVLIWAFDAPMRMRPRTRKLLADRKNRLLVSAASLWEISIKISIGRLPALPEGYLKTLQAEGFTLLDVTPLHALAVREFPLLHRDPFDRMLAVQSKLLNVPLISSDRKIAQYDIEIIPA